ncbi:MAG TPA: metalloregulator ArsR/SmtB family transcription factor [Candidatus Deferrimicrobium sp.]|nr:metalloregulator ArsR/SmtB family transcription factor [Candidatus Deferrimicrobium sp.]
MKDNTDTISEFLKVLAHPIRLRIIECLKAGEKSVNDIQSELNKSQSTISQHLKILTNANIMTYRKNGLKSYYKISQPKIHAIILALSQYISELNKDHIEDITNGDIIDTLY